jgi:hypothetical protein
MLTLTFRRTVFGTRSGDGETVRAPGGGANRVDPDGAGR